MKRLAIISGLASAALVVGLVIAPTAQAATSTKVVRYGPYTVPGGTMAEPGMINN